MKERLRGPQSRKQRVVYERDRIGGEEEKEKNESDSPKEKSGGITDGRRESTLESIKVTTVPMSERHT